MSNASYPKISPSTSAPGQLEGLPQGLLDHMNEQSPSATDKTDKAFMKRASKALRVSKNDEDSLGPRKVVNILRKALNLFHSARYRESLQLTLQATELHPESALGYHLMAMTLEKMGATHKALLMYEKTLELDPTEFDVYLNLGLTARQLGMEDAAEKFFRIYIDLQPDMPQGYNDLGGLLRDQNKFDDAIEIVRLALNLMPDKVELWNTMGSIASETQQIDQAITFYNEALRLDPNFHRARYNLGNIHMGHGLMEQALENYDDFLAKTPSGHADAMEGIHARSMALLALGRLKEGWRDYQVRSKPLFRASPLYATTAPMWNGEDICGKTVLVIGEQGVGDEIMFANPIRDLIDKVGSNGNVLISVTERLAPLYERTFPQCKVASPVFTHHNGKLVHITPWQDDLGPLDYYTPMADLSLFLRTDAQSYQADGAVLTPDPQKVAEWKSRLAEISDGPYVGLCWRSGLLTSGRKKHYADLDLWGPILKREGVTFINLQYGEVDEELQKIADKFGQKVHQMDGINLKDDLDDNAALCAALDLVISAPTAASALSGSVGTKTWILAAHQAWVMLGEKTYPWYADTTPFIPETFGDWPNAIASVNLALNDLLENT